LEDIDIDGRLEINLKSFTWIVEWIYVAQNRKCWRDFVSTEMNHWFSYKIGDILPLGGSVASQELICYMDSVI
jgi:hypothetical protein